MNFPYWILSKMIRIRGIHVFKTTEKMCFFSGLFAACENVCGRNNNKENTIVKDNYVAY